MNQNAPVKEVKEYSFFELLSRTWGFFIANLKDIALIILLVYIPINFLLVLIPIEMVVTENNPIGGLLNYSRLISVFEALFGVIATLALAFLVESKMNNKGINYKEALGKSLGRWAAALGTEVVLGILLIILFLLLIIPGVIFSVYWAFAIYAVALREKWGWNALSYSYSVVKNRWWKVFGISAVLVILSFCLSVMISIVNIIVSFPLVFLPESVFTGLIDGVLNLIFFTINDFVTSFFTLAGIFLFINLEQAKQPQKDNK